MKTVTFRFDRWFTKECELMLSRNNISSYEFDGIYCVLTTDNKNIVSILESAKYVEVIF